MSKANEIVAMVTSDIGKHRNNVGCAGTNDWCAMYVSHVLKTLGIGDVASLWCTYMWQNMENSKDWSEPNDNPKPGDVVFFDWDHAKEERPLDHVAIITDYNNGVVTYVDGNGGGSSYINRRTIRLDSGYIAYWMRYIGDGKTSTTTTTAAKTETKTATTETKKETVYCEVKLEQLSEGCKSNSVETLQNLLNDLGYGIKVDGDFGKNTSEALAKFQKSAGLTCDRVCGKATWKALIEA